VIGFSVLYAATPPKSIQRQHWTFPGYQGHNVPYDGQCAFTAIGHQLALNRYKSGDSVSGNAVRHDIVMFINSNQQLRTDIAERLEADGNTIGDYITGMAKHSTWIDENAMFAASLLYDVTIDILRDDGSSPVRIGSSTSNRSVVLGYVSCYPGEPQHITSVLYRYHYQVLL
jgi:hypothetical protein